MSQNVNSTSIALQKKLMESLNKNVKEVEEYKQWLKAQFPVYDTAPEDMFEKPLKYEKQVYYPASAEEIEKTATNALKPDYDIGREKITNDILSKISDIEKKKTQTSEDKYYALNALAQKYADLNQKKEAEMIDRGLGRSSIKEQSKKDLQKEENENKEKTVSDYETKDKKLSDDITSQEEKMDQKLKEFERKYEVNLAGKIDSLTKAEQKKVDAVSKANEGLTEKELKEQAIYDKNVQDEYAARRKAEKKAQEEYDRKSSTAEQNGYLTRYLLAKKMYGAMKTDVALELIDSNTELEKLLGKRYLEMLRRSVVINNVD